jgi:uncharacterized protein YlxW (UPF0749 family)
MNWKAFKSLNALIVSFVVAGIFIGVLVAAQFQSSVAANSYLVDEINAQKDLLTSFDQDRLILKNTIARLRLQIEENQAKLQLVSDQAKLDKLESLKAGLGLTKMRGSGVRILFTENPNKKPENEATLIHAADLRDLVNILRTAKAEGISINGQRITPNSTINALGSEVLVNKVKVAPPYEIYVIGDTELLGRRLNDEKSYPDLYNRIKNRDVGFEVEKLEQVVLPLYDGDYLLKYTNDQG